MLPNPFGSFDMQQAPFNLNQIKDYKPVESFTDDANVHWVLTKASTDSTKDVPDYKNVQFTECWGTPFPGIKTKIYVYVVEGIKLPRSEAETPSRIIYQWFSDVAPTPAFNPTMITPREWLKANVYAAPITDARVSKLKAICRYQEQAEQKKHKNKLQKI